MSNTKKRKKQEQVRMNSEGKYTKEQIEAFERILLSAQPTDEEVKKMRYYRIFQKRVVRKLCMEVYGVDILFEKKSFRKALYEEYAFGKVYGDFSGVHGMMVTKCPIFDNNWKNYIDKNGKAVNKYETIN